MGSLTTRVVVIAAVCGTLFAVGALAREAAGADPAPGPASAAGPVPIPLYRATGVLDQTGVATAVHCTNLGAATASVSVAFRDFDGALDCVATDSDIGQNQTTTITTRPLAFIFEDVVCSVAPLIQQGSLLISANNFGATNIICTVQVLDAAASPPVFATTLDLFRP